MTKEFKMNDPKKGWEALENGTYLKDYRTALQKAIDKHSEYVSVPPKSIVEEGDLRMFTSIGWEPFNIGKAANMVHEGLMLAMQRYQGGEWIEIDSSVLYESLKKSTSSSLADNQLEEWWKEIKSEHPELVPDHLFNGVEWVIFNLYVAKDIVHANQPLLLRKFDDDKWILMDDDFFHINLNRALRGIDYEKPEPIFNESQMSHSQWREMIDQDRREEMYG